MNTGNLITREDLILDGYMDARQLEDGSWVALQRLMFTYSIVTGVTVTGWAKRFCFEHEHEAREQMATLKGVDDEPTGWIARRPQV